jgi:hypothetical protein
MREFLGASVVAAGLALVAPFAAFAQTGAIPARIVTQINESSLTTLRGNTHPLARPQYDQGAVADSMPMHRMLLLLQRSPQQETALRTLIDQQQSKTSPSFHQWLTPQQFGQQYGAAPADIQTVTSWLTSHGFQVARVSTAGTLIEFSGIAGQVLNAFHTQIHRYVVNGEEHFANSTDPQIPTALASVVAGPVSLHNFPRKAQSHIRGVFQKDRKTGKVTAVPSPTFTFASTDCTSNTIFSSNCFAIAPGDFNTIYNVNPLLTTGISGHVIDGTGQTIAIVGDSEICTASSPDFSGNCTVDDVANFRSLFGLSTTNLPNVILDGPDPGFNGDEIEGNLDVQWSGAIAPGATIDFVIAEGTEVSAGTDLAAEYIVDNNLAPVMSESFSQCEAFLLANGNLFESALWEQAAAQGITVIVSAGDSGSAGCDDQSSQTSAVNGANVNGIASTPFNVAAGGTDFDFTATNYPSAYWLGPTSNSATDVSAQGYIPETTWNDSCARSGLTGCNSIAATSPLLNIVGGGGGQSTCVAAVSDVNGNISCPTASYTNATIGGWTKPAYQPIATGSGLNLMNDLTRDLPDVSLFASDGILSNSFYIVCEADISGGQCNLSQSFINFVGVGGTSSSAPSFAGIMALINENMAVNNPTLSPRQGNANYVLYSLDSGQISAATTGGYSCNSSTSPNSACIFNDVTKGNNSVPCAAGSFNCSNTGLTGLGVVETGTPAGTPSYITGTGFDLATGLGSVNVTNLVSMWPNNSTGVGSFTPTTTTLCLSTTSGACTSSTTASSITGTVTHGTTTIYVNIGVTSGSGAPPSSTEAKPEDVALIGTFSGGSTAGVDRFDANTGNVDIYQLTSGTISASTNELVGGTYTISARYGGDGKFGSSTSTPGISITVVPENSTTSLSLFAASGNNSVAISTVPYGAFDTIRADVKGISGLETGTGTVTLLDNGNPIVTPFDTTSNSFPLNTEGYTEDQTTFLSVGTHSFTGQYGGDASYNASAISTAIPLTVTLGPTTTTVHSSVTSVAPNTNFTLTAFIDTQSSTNPTGGSQGVPPSGTVTFFSGTTNLGSAPVSAISGGDVNGFDESTATLATAQLAATGTITAVYNGDVNYSTSTSPGLTVTVTNGATFSLSPASNGVMTVGAPGQSGTDLITVSGSGGFSGTITLSSAVSMTPPSATDIPTCSFGAPDQNFTAPGTITLTTTSETGSATMTCATTAAAHIVPGPSSRPSGRVWPLASAAISLAGIFFLLMVPSQRRWKLVPLVVLLAVVAAAGISCSGGGSGAGGGVTNPGTTTGTYTFTVTATPSIGTAQTTPITVNVQ